MILRKKSYGGFSIILFFLTAVPQAFGFNGSSTLPAGLSVLSAQEYESTSAFRSFEGEKLVYKTDDHFLMANMLENLTNENLFVVKLDGVSSKFQSGFEDFRVELEKISMIHHFIDGDFALVEPKPGKEGELASVAHDFVEGCGALVQLGAWSEIADNKAAKYRGPLQKVESVIPEVSQLVNEIDDKKIYDEILSMEAMGTRYYRSETGKAVPSYLAERYTRHIPENRNDVSIEFVPVKRSPQDNIVIRIEGSEKPEEVIILGSHIDSIISGRDRGSVAPGADDNASGTATNLEIFRVMMESGIKPKRTVEIHGYAAEEIGLVGSAQLADAYRRNSVDVIAMVQMDMNLFSGRRQDLSTMYFVTNDTNKQLTEALATLSSNYLEVKTVKGGGIGGTSDHKSWDDRGFVAAFPFENPRNYNSHIHSERDRAELVGNAKFSQLYAKMGLAYVLHFAGY